VLRIAEFGTKDDLERADVEVIWGQKVRGQSRGLENVRPDYSRLTSTATVMQNVGNALRSYLTCDCGFSRLAEFQY